MMTKTMMTMVKMMMLIMMMMMMLLLLSVMIMMRMRMRMRMMMMMIIKFNHNLYFSQIFNYHYNSRQLISHGQYLQIKETLQELFFSFTS